MITSPPNRKRGREELLKEVYIGFPLFTDTHTIKYHTNTIQVYVFPSSNLTSYNRRKLL